MMLSMVGRTSFMSWRFAPSIVRPIGTPCPSVSKLRLTPLLPRSVGLGPVFFPAQRRFGHRPVHTQPLPVNATEFIKLLNSGLPECEEDSRLHPLLKAIIGCRVRTQLGLIQGLPLATRSQHVEDGIGTVAIRHPWASSPKAMGIHMHRQQRLQLRPQLIRDAKSRRRAIIRGPLSFSFSFPGFLSVHTSYFTTFSGYSDRHLVRCMYSRYGWPMVWLSAFSSTRTRYRWPASTHTSKTTRLAQFVNASPIPSIVKMVPL